MPRLRSNVVVKSRLKLDHVAHQRKTKNKLSSPRAWFLYPSFSVDLILLRAKAAQAFFVFLKPVPVKGFCGMQQLIWLKPDRFFYRNVHRLYKTTQQKTAQPCRGPVLETSVLIEVFCVVL